MDITKTNMTAPDLTHIPDGLVVGSVIQVRGRVSTSESRFIIRLQMEERHGCDVALSFCPRNDTCPKTVVRNSYESGEWQVEEKDIPSFPFTNGANFLIRINVLQDEYRINVNGSLYTTFKHRLNFQDVKYIKLFPDADYHEVTIHTPCPPKVSHNKVFNGGLQKGKAVKVVGYVNDDSERIVINFSCDEEGNMIALHFNPRQNQNDTVLNSRTCKGWGPEQRGFPSFPFAHGEMFTVIFILGDNAFNIFVNGDYFTSYEYRDYGPEDIKSLQCDGGATLMDVRCFDPLGQNFDEPVGALNEGDMVCVNGVFHTGGDRMSVNLMSDGDYVLHFNPRRAQGEVVLNNTVNGGWQNEEKHPLPDCLKDDEHEVMFDVEIFNKGGVFKIFLNGVFFADFKIRGENSEITAITGNQDADFLTARISPKVDCPTTDAKPSPQSQWLAVSGVPTEGAVRFEINMQSEDCHHHRDTIALHYNPRFEGNHTVRNSVESGSWQNEEREECSFPFEVNALFKIHLVTTDDDFRVFVNGKRHIRFAHRVNKDIVKYVMLTGDCDFQEPEFY